MAEITLNGDPVTTWGELPRVGAKAPVFTLVDRGLAEVRSTELLGAPLVLNIFPSLDTPVCAMSVRRFNQEAASRPGVLVLCVSADLPFAHKRFCEMEGIDDVLGLSVFRSQEFGRDYGVEIVSGPLRGLLSRAVLVLDPQGRVLYGEQVADITSEPDYEAALNALP